jgi:alpha-glucosidase
MINRNTVSSDYKEHNLKNQLATPRSHINIFKSLIKLRQKKVLQEGSFESLVDDNLLIYKREYQGKQLYVVLNLGQNDQEVNLSSKFPNIPETIRVSVSSLNSDLIEG